MKKETMIDAAIGLGAVAALGTFLVMAIDKNTAPPVPTKDPVQTIEDMLRVDPEVKCEKIGGLIVDGKPRTDAYLCGGAYYHELQDYLKEFDDQPGQAFKPRVKLVKLPKP